MRLEGREPAKNNHRAVPDCGSPELQGRTEKERTPEGMEPLGEGRLMHLKYTHVRTHTHTSLYMRDVLIRLMRPFTRLTEEVVLNQKKYQKSLIGLQELSDRKSLQKFSPLTSGCND